jgi:membrane protein required for colicin V production
MNAFDMAVALGAATAVVLGFRAGLVRSAATIVAYACAAPFAVKATSLLVPALGTTPLNASQTALLFLVVLMLLGIAVTAAFRAVIDELSGSEIVLADRLAGSALGIVRIALMATTVVLVCDRIIPVGREPAFFVGSQLRPLFSLAAQHGLKSLPPETAPFIDQIGRQRRIQSSPST